MTALSQLASQARTIDANATPKEAALLMDREHVGSLVVFEGGRPAGMVSDRDIALYGLIDAPTDGSARIRHCMRTPLVTLSAKASLGEAARLMRTNSVRRLVLLDEQGDMQSVVSADDLLRFLGTQVGHLSTAIGREFQAETQRGSRGSAVFGSE